MNQTRHSKTGLAAIFGTGRSGTTFLGSVIDSHPDVAYRFEPVHRNLVGPWRDLLTKLEAIPQNKRVGMLRESFAPGPSRVDKPPFFRKRARATFAMRGLYPAARKIRGVDAIFEKLGRARPSETVIIKEVTFELLMHRLAALAATPCLYLVRHPVATCLSVLRGQQAGRMPTGRQGVLGQMLEDHRPDLLERYGPDVDSLSLFEKNLLLWRMDVDRAFEAERENPSVRFVVYETLCRNLHAETERVLSHFGLSMDPQVTSYLDSLSSVSAGSRRMFSVRKNPASTADAWMQRVTDTQQQQAARLLDGHELVERLVSEGVWQPLQAPSATTVRRGEPGEATHSSQHSSFP